MSRRLAPIGLVALMAAALSGCGSFGAIGLGPMERSAKPVESDTLPPVASAPVTRNTLPPPPMDPNAQTAAPIAEQGTLPGATPIESTPSTPPPVSTASGAEIGRTDLLGGWTLQSGGESCQLFMTLTSWTGGYRASTRGCQSATLKSISAWSLNGSQVVLAGANGVSVASLTSSGKTQFNGQLNSGGAVSFYR
ncbi:AprI/Inh family metalloprotease inhibitor [Kaistia nematophila]|uniref:AprI/Inh family metalloprotease inhibitor n=1 Tax=Kaistia nematophila TaxID=2994654 RepID=A0A9X3E244_9HYPH|nr:AprI/Inh family metalloprotease inhibitor [Kaistia nematophila]MCX5570014.1 AprI/Inh family metalloprotease inhibitor [Kaistia nematophila]